MYLPESAGWLAALGVPAVLWMVMDRLEPDTADPPADQPSTPPVPPPPPRPRPMPLPPAEDTVDYPPGGDGGHREPAGPPSKEGHGGRDPAATTPVEPPAPTPRRYGTGVISGFSTWVSALIWGDPDTGGGLFGRSRRK